MAEAMEVDLPPFQAAVNQLETPCSSPQPLAPAHLHPALQRLTLFDRTVQPKDSALEQWVPALANAVIQLAAGLSDEHEVKTVWPSTVEEVKYLEKRLVQTFFSGEGPVEMSTSSRENFLDVLLLTDKGKELTTAWASPLHIGWTISLIHSLAPGRDAERFWRRSLASQPFSAFTNHMLDAETPFPNILDESCLPAPALRATVEPVPGVDRSTAEEIFHVLSARHAQGRPVNADVDFVAVLPSQRPADPALRKEEAEEMLEALKKVREISTSNRSQLWEEKPLSSFEDVNVTTEACIIRLSYEPPNRRLRVLIDILIAYKDTADIALWYFASSVPVVRSLKYRLFRTKELVLTPGGLFSRPATEWQLMHVSKETFLNVVGIEYRDPPLRQGANPRWPYISLAGKNVFSTDFKAGGWAHQLLGPAATSAPITLKVPLNPSPPADDAPPPPPPGPGGDSDGDERPLKKRKSSRKDPKRKEKGTSSQEGSPAVATTSGTRRSTRTRGSSGSPSSTRTLHRSASPPAMRHPQAEPTVQPSTITTPHRKTLRSRFKSFRERLGGNKEDASTPGSSSTVQPRPRIKAWFNTLTFGRRRGASSSVAVPEGGREEEGAVGAVTEDFQLPARHRARPGLEGAFAALQL
ncbi:hypothetical protein JCM10213v2_004102 [Rhodosporidiobolus nylandii]